MTNQVRDTIDAESQRLFLQALLDRGCTFISRTWLLGRPYVWVKDEEGKKMFLERIPLEDVLDA